MLYYLVLNYYDTSVIWPNQNHMEDNYFEQKIEEYILVGIIEFLVMLDFLLGCFSFYYFSSKNVSIPNELCHHSPKIEIFIWKAFKIVPFKDKFCWNENYLFSFNLENEWTFFSSRSFVINILSNSVWILSPFLMSHFVPFN